MGDGRPILLTTCHQRKATAEEQEGIEDGVSSTHSLQTSERSVLFSKIIALFQAILAHHQFLFLFYPFES
jgi:hypothetical protein